VTISLALALLACIPETDAQKQVRELEARLRQFPPAEAIANNLALSEKHYCWLVRTGLAIPSHRRNGHAAHLADAKRLYDAWSYLDQASRNLKDAKCPPMGGGSYNPFRTVESMLFMSERGIELLESSLGEEAFCAGRMPPPVPIWRFLRID
jgi:hypothetical protein